MKKNIIVLIALVVILTGCSNEYNLTFSNKGVKEEIITTILSSDIKTQSQAEKNAGIESDDRITPFIEEEQYPFANDTTKKYDKKVDKKNGLTTVNLTYNYSFDEYKKSKAYTQCFKYKSLDYNDNGYLLEMSGIFYCLYGDEVKINIKTNNKVISHNANKVSGNTYTWIINKDNVAETDIKINISKESTIKSYAMYIVLGILAIVLIVCGYIAFQKINNRDEINKI